MNTNQQTQEELDKELQERLSQLTPEELEKEIDELLHPERYVTWKMRWSMRLFSLHFNFLVLIGDLRRAFATFKRSVLNILKN